MRKFKILTIVFLLILAVEIPVQAAEFQQINSTVKKNGSYYMWIDTQQRLHIRKTPEKKDWACITGCDGGVSDGKTVYYWDREGNGILISKYSITSCLRKRVAYLQGIRTIVGAYKNRLILEGNLDHRFAMDKLYVYDMKNGKIKEFDSYPSTCESIYKQFFVFRGTTGVITATRLGVYNAETDKIKMLTKDCWYMEQNGRNIYYATEVSGSSSYVARKMKIFRYSITTGKKKAVSKTITVSVHGNNSLSKNRFVYSDEKGRKHIIRFN